MNLRLLFAIAFSVVIFGPISPLRSQTLQVDNTGNTLDQYEFVNSGPSTQYLGEGFTTGSTGGLSIDSVSLVEPAVNSGLTLSLYSSVFSSSNNAMVPGAALGTFTLSTSSGMSGDLTVNYTPNTTLTLSASTQYWLVLSSTSASGAWGSTHSSAFTSNNGWTIDTDNFAYSAAGSSWDLVTGSKLGGNTLQFSVSTAESVPEPSTWTLILFGVVGLAWFARRRAQA